MTLRSYIEGRYSSVGHQLGEAALLSVLSHSSIGAEDEIVLENALEAEKLFVESLPEILLFPTSVSELGVSISRTQRRDLEAYYRYKCRKLGIPDRLTQQNTVTIL